MILQDEIAEGGGAFRLSLSPLASRAALAEEWQAMAARAGVSAFLSLPWIGTFLDLLPAGFVPHILRLERAGVTLGIGLLVEHKGRWALNESGDPALDAPMLEYNRLIMAPEAPPALAQIILQRLMVSGLAPRGLHLGGLPAAEAQTAQTAARASGWLVRPLQIQQAHWLDLTAYGGDPSRFRAALGRNSRQAVQRAEKLYRQGGPLTWETAVDQAEALEIFRDLERLHTAQWQARGQPGAFAQPSFRAFHDRLIREGAGEGLVRLHRLRAGDETIGCLYNLRFAGRIYAYQSGFAFSEDSRRKPGYLAHALAIEQAIGQGAERYDFCAGTTQLKQSFASHGEPMHWLHLLPPTPLNRLIAWARNAKNAWRVRGHV